MIIIIPNTKHLLKQQSSYLTSHTLINFHIRAKFGFRKFLNILVISYRKAYIDLLS